ncbi:unnamed protein product [Kluyveromyces dobzhanskii CBS 2104]|uniref:WGS project CCBQ000000000 data, contig 00058 n=1 Tax=Kluyveromyces dobzhanskii CBS 2104 TaxID=1427455 RepID=A0A0A8LDD0_9SACH|nr:unnamed protein product [Kluyveromyces dobzhanskii CBS 2104]
MTEVKDRCTSVDGNEPWGVVDGSGSTYIVRNLDAGEMDDILSVTSSDLEDSAVLQMKKENNVSPSPPPTSLPQSAPDRATPKTSPLSVPLTKLQTIVLGVSLVAGLINVGILTVFIRDMNGFIKSNDLQCNELAFKDRIPCQFDAYMGSRAHAYEAAHLKKPALSSTLATYYSSFPSLDQCYQVYEKSLKSGYSATSKWVNDAVKADNFKSVQKWTKSAKDATENQMTAFYHSASHKFSTLKNVHWPRPRPRASISKLRVKLQTIINSYQGTLKHVRLNEIPYLAKVSVPLIWHRSSVQVQIHYHKILDLLRVSK